MNERSLEKHNGLYDLWLITATILFVIFYSFGEIWACNFLVMIIYTICEYVQFKEKRYGSFFFYLTFFLFLLGTIFFGLFDETLKYRFASEENELHALLCITIALVGVYMGSIIYFRFKLSLGSREKQQIEIATSTRFKIFMKYLSIVALIMNIIEASVKAVFVMANSYLAYYTDFQTPLPYIVKWFSAAAPMIFYFFLGTLPTRKMTRIPIALYLSVGVIALFYGQRNVFVTRFIIVLCYLLLRNRIAIEDEEKWINKRQLSLLMVVIPFGIVFMSFWQNYRSGLEYSQTSLFKGVMNGLLQQGNDIAIIDFESRFRNALPDKPYAIGGIIAVLHNNLIGRLIGLAPIPVEMRTVETALNGYSFEAALMYLENRNGYMLGYGIGSCYIAELYNSFSYIGVFVGSFIYGVILKMLTHFRVKGFIVNGFALYIFQRLLMSPRANFDGFISGIIQISNLFLALLLWGISRYVWPEESNG